MIDAVVVAVKEKTSSLEASLQEMYNSAPICQITNAQATGICAKYNVGIDFALQQYSSAITANKKNSESGFTSENPAMRWTIFSHDDAILKSNNINSLLLTMAKQGADIVGVAGNTQIPKLDPGYWWDGLVTGEFRGAGAVIHRTPETDNMFHIESYGPYPQQVTSLDGVWIAVRTACLKNINLRFDADTYPGYHYYDVDFCATARSLGLNIWVGGILLLHDKWGKGIEDPSFEIHKELFIKKWSKQKHLYYKGQPLQKNNSFVKNTTAFGG